MRYRQGSSNVGGGGLSPASPTHPNLESPGLPLPLVDAFRSREPGGHRIFQPPCLALFRADLLHSRQLSSSTAVPDHHSPQHRKRAIGVAQPGRAIPPSKRSCLATHSTRHEPHCRRIGPCLRSCHGAAGFPRAILVAVDGDASFGRLVVESFCSRPAESRTPCSNEPRSRRPLRNVQTQWDEGALSNPGAGFGNWKAGRKITRKERNTRRAEPEEGEPEGSQAGRQEGLQGTGRAIQLWTGRRRMAPTSAMTKTTPSRPTETPGPCRRTPCRAMEIGRGPARVRAATRTAAKPTRMRQTTPTSRAPRKRGARSLMVRLSFFPPLPPKPRSLSPGLPRLSRANSVSPRSYSLRILPSICKSRKTSRVWPGNRLPPA